MNAEGYWNNGMLEDWVGVAKSVFIWLPEIKKINPDPYLLLIRNIPLFHYSIGCLAA